MSSGAMVNILVSIIFYPVVTRLYSEEDFGNYGLLFSVITTLGLVATLLYPTGLVIPKFRKQFYSLLKLCFILTGLSTAVICLWILLFKQSFLFVFKLYNVEEYLFLIPIGVILVSLKTILLNVNVRKKLFKENAFSNVLAGSSLKFFNVLYALSITASSFGLLITHFVSIIIQVVTLGLNKMKLDIRAALRSDKSDLLKAAKEYKKYPLNLLPGNIINKYTSDLPILLLGVYFDAALAGAYVLANSILSIPLNVLGVSMSTVFLQKSNELHIYNPEKLASFTRKLNHKMALLGTLAFGFIFAFGDYAFYLAFGKKWLVAGSIASILSIYFIIKLVSGPLAVVFRSVGKEQYSLYASMVLGILRTAGLYLGFYYQSFTKAVLFFTIGSMIGYLFTLILVYKATNLPAFKIAFEIVCIVSIGFLMFYLLRIGIDRLFNFQSLIVE
jgi:O-antigen/teichoic acid export membrane protein